MRVCFIVDLMTRQEITEAEQQWLDRYKERRDEYVRELTASAPPLSGEQRIEEPEAVAGLAGLMRDAEPPVLPRRTADPSRPRPGRV
jgi:hypothetical protein